MGVGCTSSGAFGKYSLLKELKLGEVLTRLTNSSVKQELGYDDFHLTQATLEHVINFLPNCCERRRLIIIDVLLLIPIPTVVPYVYTYNSSVSPWLQEGVFLMCSSKRSCLSIDDGDLCFSLSEDFGTLKHQAICSPRSPQRHPHIFKQVRLTL